MSLQILSQISGLLYEFNTCSVAFRIVLSAVIGGFIGFERGYHGRVAGLRTHILVCLGSTLAAVVAFAVVLVTMSILTRLEREQKDQGRCLFYLEISDVDSVNRFQERLADRPVELQILTARSGLPGSVGLELSVPKGYDWTGMMDELRALEYVSLVIPVSYTPG